jgi:hypothetical protein
MVTVNAKEQVMKEKQFYKRFNEDFHVLYDNRYISVLLSENDLGCPMCYLGGCDDWELSYTAQDAEDKFNALLEISGEVSFEQILALGFTQYG